MKAEYELIIRDERYGLEAFLVIHNTARGVGKGGIRFVNDISLEEVRILAEVMTWKNALANLPLGGAKAGIKNNGKSKSILVRRFARKLKYILGKMYVAGPDMYMGEKEMAIIADEAGMGSATGKPESLGGLPHELGSTGFGVAIVTKELLNEFDGIEGKRVAIEGFGNVGTFTFKFLEKFGAKIVAVSDSKGTIYNEEGISYEELYKIKKERGSVIYHKGKVLESSKIFELDVDVLIPGARPNVINESNWERVKAKYIVEASNSPIKEEIEEKLAKKGKIIVPDILANAGGVISSYAEMRGLTKEEMFRLVEYKLKESLKSSIQDFKNNLRKNAMEIAKERVRDAEEKRSS